MVWTTGSTSAISFRSDDPDAIQSAYVTPTGTKAELVQFLRDHDTAVPAALLDAEGQAYLWEEAVDHAAPWEAVRLAVIGQYS